MSLLAKVCRKKLASKTEQAHNKPEKANVTVEDDKQENSEEYPLFHVSSGSSKPLQVAVLENGNHLVMEIDTSASVSIVSEETFNHIQKGLDTVGLQKSSVQLQTYTREAIKVLGSITVLVEHNDQNTMLSLIVTEGDGPTLLGRDWLTALKLDWKTVFKVGVKRTLQEVLDKHSNVFKDGLGEL